MEEGLAVPSNGGWTEIDYLVGALKLIASDLSIIVVANRQTSNSASDYSAHSVQTEYFSDEEIEQIVGAMRGLNLYVQSYFSEDDFIKAVHSGEFDSIPRKLKLVYNAAQTGVGPGRKSLVPAFCQLHNIAITSSDAYVVSLARQKFHTAMVLKSMGLPVAESWCYMPVSGWLQNKRPSQGMKVIMKLTYESASIGLDHMSVCEVDADLDEKIRLITSTYNQPVTVQRFISGLEVEAPVIGLVDGFVPMLVGITIGEDRNLGGRFLTYDLVYAEKYGFYEYRGKGIENIARVAREVFTTLGIRGIGRIDFRIDESGAFFVIDVATSPHIVRHSTLAYTFRATHRPYPDLISILAALACRREGWL
jgi:D-alanine-D-alanine ligase